MPLKIGTGVANHQLAHLQVTALLKVVVVPYGLIGRRDSKFKIDKLFFDLDQCVGGGRNTA